MDRVEAERLLSEALERDPELQRAARLIQKRGWVDIKPEPDDSQPVPGRYYLTGKADKRVNRTRRKPARSSVKLDPVL
jgi:hypothetical protein